MPKRISSFPFNILFLVTGGLFYFAPVYATDIDSPIKARTVNMILFINNDYLDETTSLKTAFHNTTVFNLDEVLNIEAKLSDGINSKVDADEIMKTLSPKHKAQLTRGWEGLIKAAVLNVNAIPAIVIDEQYVIYGITDFNLAFDIYQQREHAD